MDETIRAIQRKWQRTPEGRTPGLSPSERMDLVAARRATDARLLGRSCEALLGICAGELADGVLNDEEIRFLDLWLDEHAPIATTWPGEVIYSRAKEVLRDGLITKEERSFLTETLSQLVGGGLRETGTSFGMASTLPLDTELTVEIPARSFCFTGTFLYGTRSACERAVTARAGLVGDGITIGLDYLVVGTMTTQDWAHATFGRKIEKAVAYRARGYKIRIVGENQWVAALG